MRASSTFIPLDDAGVAKAALLLGYPPPGTEHIGRGRGVPPPMVGALVSGLQADGSPAPHESNQNKQRSQASVEQRQRRAKQAAAARARASQQAARASQAAGLGPQRSAHADEVEHVQQRASQVPMGSPMVMPHGGGVASLAPGRSPARSKSSVHTRHNSHIRVRQPWEKRSHSKAHVPSAAAVNNSSSTSAHAARGAPPLVAQVVADA